MAVSYKVQFWEHRVRPDRRKPYQVRWSVAGREFSESFLTKTQADGRKADLLVAARAGEPFDLERGLPRSELRLESDISWYQHARNYVEARWAGAPAKTRTTWADALASVTFEMVRSTAGMPDKRLVRLALYSWGFNVNRWDQEPPADIARALAWVAKQSLMMSELESAKHARRMLDAASVKLDGKPASASTTLRKRRILGHILGRALEEGLVTAHPFGLIQWEPPDTEEQVDPGVVVNPEQARLLLHAVGRQGRVGPTLKAFFGCMYYAAMRPAEVVKLDKSRCSLPESGWGRLVLTASSPRVGKSWTDDGAAHEHRGLKHRSAKATRPVPIPPELVAMLREHIDRFGLAPDGRLFRTGRDGMVQESTYGRVWAQARGEVLDPVDLASPLGKRPYDLRHACVSLWLNSGVDPTEVARRAGHSVAVLLRVYAKCLSGSEERANRLISERLGERTE